MGDMNENKALKELINEIGLKKVIPVIGQGLYKVDIESKNKQNVSLYDYLAEKVLEQCTGEEKLTPDLNRKFAKVCLRYLNENPGGYLQLSDFLKETLKGVRLQPDNVLWKLRRIKNFNIFINTSFDDLLERTLKKNRFIPTKILAYSKNESYLNKLDDRLFCTLEEYRCTLLYYIFGNLSNNKPAYTGNDLFESMMGFWEDMFKNPDNKLFQKLKSHSFLFICCGFDNCFFRFFIRILTGKSYDSFTRDQTFKLFVVDNFKEDSENSPNQELYHFLRDNGVIIFQTTDGNNFVEKLFEKIRTECPEMLIYPTAYISFDKQDKSAAKLLMHNLREDGIDVWWEDMELEGMRGSDTANNQCPVFIPIISENSKQYGSYTGAPKPYLDEWKQASRKVKLEKLTILPVAIDDTNFKPEDFPNTQPLKITAGKRDEDYEKLKNQLLDIQSQKRCEYE